MSRPDIAEHHGFHKNPEHINRKGRPPGPNRGTIAKKLLAMKEKVQVLDEKGELVWAQLSREEIMTLALFKEAKNGDVSAYNALMDSAHGKATQQMDIDADVTINIPPIKWVKPD